MSQTLSQAEVPAASRRMAQFGVALIALILVACFAILIVARASAQPVVDVPAALMK